MGHSVARRAGFWLTQVGKEDAVAKLKKHLGNLRVPVLLDPSKRYGNAQRWPVDREWGIVINIPERAFTGWIAYAK